MDEFNMDDFTMDDLNLADLTMDDLNLADWTMDDLSTENIKYLAMREYLNDMRYYRPKQRAAFVMAHHQESLRKERRNRNGRRSSVIANDAQSPRAIGGHPTLGQQSLEKINALMKKNKAEELGGYRDMTPEDNEDPLLQVWESCELRNPPKDEEIYLELENSVIFNSDFHIIKSRGWFSDQIFNVGFDLLERVTDCATHKIALANCYYAQTCQKIANPKYSDPKHSNDDEETGYRHHRSEKQKFMDKDFIFLPITDGMEITESGEDKGGGVGMHWTLLVVDCRDRDTLKATHFDSLNFPGNRIIANYVYQGIHRLLKSEGYKGGISQMTQGRHMPNQYSHNKCRREGGSACGPFVWALAKELVLYIIERYEDGLPVKELALTKDFQLNCGWDSAEIRTIIHNLLVRQKRMNMWNEDRKRLVAVVPIPV